MPACSFCGENLARGIGTLYVKKDGSTFFICSGKCKKNLLVLNREGRRRKWTEANKRFKEISKVQKKK